jgi:hypothetical protein
MHVRPTFYLALCTLMSACAKDPIIPTTSVDKVTLQDELVAHGSERIRTDAFAFAGDHPSFERETDDAPIHVYAFIPEGATRLTYYETDTLAFRDSLNAYRRKEIEAETKSGDRFHRFAREASRRDRYARISYWYNDSLFLSPAMAIRSQSSPTSKLGPVQAFYSSNGYFTFDWEQYPATTSYLLVLTDATATIRMALTTARSSFQFYDLRDTEHNFIPELRDPQLVDGATYTLTVYAISNRSWCNALTHTAFTYELP